MILPYKRWWKSVLAGGAAIVARIYGTSMLAVSSGAPAEAMPEYPHLNSLSAMAKFPIVYTCVQAIAGDLASLPITAATSASARSKRRGNRASRRRARIQLVEDEPALELLENPNADIGGCLFRKQLCVFFVATGNAYIYRPRDAVVPTLYLIHPNAIHPLIGPFGQVLGYKHQMGGESVTRSADEILHIREPSWQDGAASGVGESPVRPLNDDLQIEQAAKTRERGQAKTGRPDVFFTSKRGLGDHGANALVSRYEQSIDKGHRAFAVGKDVSIHNATFTPKEMADESQHETTRDAVMFTFGVPPARIGLTTTNYGTAKQQARAYWEGLQDRAKLIDEVLSRLAGPSVVLMHDFSGVEALQASYTERLMRVTTWVGIGATPKQAADFELFFDAPVPDEDISDRFASPRRPAKEVDEPQKGDTIEHEIAYQSNGAIPQVAALTAAIAGYLAASAERLEILAPSIDADADQGLNTRVEIELCYVALDAAGVPPTVARWAATEISATSLEVVRCLVAMRKDDDALALAGSDAFGHRRAQRTAEQLVNALQRAEVA